MWDFHLSSLIPYSGIGVCLQLLDHQRIENDAMMKSTTSTIISITQKLNN